MLMIPFLSPDLMLAESIIIIIVVIIIIGQYIYHDPELKDKHTRC